MNFNLEFAKYTDDTTPAYICGKDFSCTIEVLDLNTSELFSWENSSTCYILTRPYERRHPRINDSIIMSSSYVKL